MTDISAAADEDAHPAGRRQGRRLGDQAGFADTGLARDESVDRHARGGAVEGPRAWPRAPSSVPRASG